VGADYENLNERQEKSSSRGIWLWVLTAVVAYVLGIGPVARLHHKTANAGLKRAIEAVYSPVVKLLKSPVGGPLVWWVWLWTGE
jgi:hypothetical protein